jgi:acylphosphatase
MSAQKASVHISGEVQGVGFRYTTRRLAARFEVNGWVKNLPDGRVALEAEGRPEELDRFFTAIKTSRLGPNITRWEETSGPATGTESGFDVRF